MSDTISGGCFCGKVTFEVQNNFEQFHLCHCIECRKMTGTAHASLLFGSPDAIEWKSGEECIKRFDHPKWELSKAFCSECGSAVPFISKGGDALIVPAGSLDETPKITPQDNIFWVDRAGWYDEAKQAAQFDGFPG